MENKLQWQMTSKHEKLNISASTDRIFLKFQTVAQGTKSKLEMLEMKMTSNGRWPQNIKSWISPQPLIESSSNFKLRLRGPNQNWKWLKWTWPTMEDDLKILKVEYIRNQLSDLTKISNWGSGDQIRIWNAWNEDHLKWKTTSKY